MSDTPVILNVVSHKRIGEDEPSTVTCSFDGEQITVPMVMENRHYQEIMKQVEAGELTIQAADEE